LHIIYAVLATLLRGCSIKYRVDNRCFLHIMAGPAIHDFTGAPKTWMVAMTRGDSGPYSTGAQPDRRAVALAAGIASILFAFFLRFFAFFAVSFLLRGR
jgi:hypothetical protein